MNFKEYFEENTEAINKITLFQFSDTINIDGEENECFTKNEVESYFKENGIPENFFFSYGTYINIEKIIAIEDNSDFKFRDDFFLVTLEKDDERELCMITDYFALEEKIEEQIIKKEIMKEDEIALLREVSNLTFEHNGEYINFMLSLLRETNQK